MRESPPVNLKRSVLVLVTSGAWMVAACGDGLGYSRLLPGAGNGSGAGSGGSGFLPPDGGASVVSTGGSTRPGATGGTVGGGMATGGTRGSRPGSGGAGATGMGVGGAGGTGGGEDPSGTGGGPAPSDGGIGGAGGAALPPRIISVDFVGTQRTPMDPTEIAGFKPAANWNSAPGTTGMLATLVDQYGVVVDGATITWSSTAANAVGFVDRPGNTRMMNGYLDPLDPAMPAQITVTGLPAAAAVASFDVIVYAIGEITTALERRTYLYSIGSTQLSVEQSKPAPATAPVFMKGTNGGMGNYVQFNDLTVNTFVLRATPGSGGHSRAPVNGIQIVMPGGT